jgi:hypothetical protein
MCAQAESKGGQAHGNSSRYPGRPCGYVPVWLLLRAVLV